MHRLAIVALIFAGVAWSLGFPLGKVALRETSAANVIFLRFAVAAIAAAPFALASPAARALFRSPAVVVAGVLYGLAFLVQFEGLARVNVSLASLLVGAMPALIAVAARVMGEKVTPIAWMGIAAATLGAALIAGKPGGGGTPLGIFLSLASLLIFLAWLVVLKRAPAVKAPMAVPAVSIVVAALSLAPVSFVMHGAPDLSLSAAAWGGIIGQGVFCTLLATAAWQYGLARVGSTTAGVFVNMEPLAGAVIGVLLFGDVLTLPLIAGGVMIIAGSFAVVLGERRVYNADLAATPVTPT